MALMVADSQAINPHRNAGGSRMSNNISGRASKVTGIIDFKNELEPA
jgi:hypothetical protein